MSVIDNCDVVRRYLEQVVNSCNLDALSQFVADDAIDHNFGLGEPQGLEGFRQHLLAVHETYGHFRVIIEDQIAEGDRVVTRVTARGVHQSRWLGLQPSHKEIVITGINIDRVRDGKIVEHWGEANTVSALFQMGAKIMPADQNDLL